MRTENPVFDFGYKPLPEGLLKPTARRPQRLRWILLAIFVAALPVAAFAWWPEEADEPVIVKHDPIEDDPSLKAIFEAAEGDTEEALRDDPPGKRAQPGYGEYVGNTKKRILRNKFGINWRTPRELNPRIIFD